MTDSSEERTGGLGAVSPLLGTRAAQTAVDALARNVEKLNSGLTKAVTALQRQTGSGNGGATLNGGKPIGGGSPYRPGQHWDSTFLGGGSGNGGGPTNQTGDRGLGGWGKAGAFVATAAIGAGVRNMPNFVTANTTAQMLGRNSSAQWDTIRGSFSRDNYTATSWADASQAGATLGTLGYTAGSSRWNAATAYNRNFGLIDPSMSASQVANAQANMTNPALYYYMQGRGISTIGPGGNVMNTGQLAHSMLQRIGTSGRVTNNDINKFMSSRGGFQNIATSMRMNGASDDTIQALSSEMRAQLTARSHGFSYDQFNAARGNAAALAKMGINSTDATKLKTTAAKQRNVEDNMATGFSKGLDTATTALNAFTDALNGLTHGPLGDLGGFGQGIGGTLASGGGSVLGGYIGAKGTKAIGKAVLKRGIPGIAGRLGGAAAAEGAAGSGAAGGVAAAAAPWAAIAALAALPVVGAHHAATAKDERALRDAAYASHGTKQTWYNNSFLSSMNNVMTFGLSDAVDNKFHGKTGDAGWKSMSTDGISGGASVAGGGSGGAGASKGGAAPKSAGGASAAKVIAIAKRYIGVPYKWGGTTPKGFDCSGLMQYSFGQAGVSLPRTSQEQARVGQSVRMNQLRPGDLVFPSDAHHVAMFIGGGKIIEAPRTGLNVRITSLRSDFTIARRVLSSVGDVGAVTGDSGTSVSGDNRSQSDMPGGGNSGVAGAGTGTSEADIVSAALGGYAGASSVGSSGKQQSSDASVSSNGSSASAGPAPKGNVGSWIKQALGILHLDANKYGAAISTIIQHESGGNPKAINKWDSNWKAGHPSKGIMQTIDSTFRAHALPGHGDIWNPVDNIIAATRYALSRYGSLDNVPGIKSLMNGGAYKGYAVGSTNIDVDQIAKVHKGEMILDAGNAEKFRDLLAGNTPTKGLLGGGGGKVILHFDKGSIVLHASGPMNDSAATDFAKRIVSTLANSTELQTIAQGN